MSGSFSEQIKLWIMVSFMFDRVHIEVASLTCLSCGRGDLLGGSILAQMHTDDFVSSST